MTALRLERADGSTENEVPPEAAATEADEILARATFALDAAGSDGEVVAVGEFAAGATTLPLPVGRGAVTTAPVAEDDPEMISEYNKTVVASPVDV